MRMCTTTSMRGCEMPTVFLAVIFVTQLATVPPVIKQGFRTLDECAGEALKMNARDPEVREPENFKLGMHYVCLQLRTST